jgi:hypothetical protein
MLLFGNTPFAADNSILETDRSMRINSTERPEITNPLIACGEPVFLSPSASLER